MKPIIRVENLGKQYRIGARQPAYGTLRETLMGAVRSPFNRFKRNGHTGRSTIWALKDVGFEVMPGEVLGVIGRNGAGKSTLLKILSRITEPTTGGVDLFGRVGSLLEVGTGFHAELTGRENVYLNGAILGMSREDVARKFDDIVSFTEIDEFLDTPVKHYSSGMYMRLAFAVAAHLEPEILLVDEVLAVGDARFQRKCLGKMSEIAKEGRTVLFVSHNMTAVQKLCNRVIWLDGGEVMRDGAMGEVTSAYLNHSFTKLTEQVWDDIAIAPGNEKVRLRSARARSKDSRSPDSISIREPFVIELEYWNLQPGACLNLALHIYNEQGVMAFATVPVHEPVWHGRPFPVGLFRSICCVPGDLLNSGVHRVELLIVKDEGIVLHREDDVLRFEIRDSIEMRGAWHGKWPGVIRPNLEWKTELVETDRSASAAIQ